MRIEKPTRMMWVDTIKLLSIFIIFLYHFIERFHSEYSFIFHNPPSSWILEGFTAKFCVALLGIFVGYFSYDSRQKNSTVYIIKRWFFFFICGLFINSLRVVLYSSGMIRTVMTADISTFWSAVYSIFVQSITIGDDIFGTYWCMFPFFVSSVISYLNGRGGVKAPGIVIQIIFFWMMNQTWIAICLIGTLVAELENCRLINKTFSKWYVTIILIVLAVLAIKNKDAIQVYVTRITGTIRSEAEIIYLINGICSGMLVLAVLKNTRIQALLSFRFLASQGRNLMTIYIIHTVVYMTLGEWLFTILPFSQYRINFCVALLICWIVIVLLSYPLQHLLDRVMRWFSLLLSKRSTESVASGM